MRIHCRQCLPEAFTNGMNLLGPIKIVVDRINGPRHLSLLSPKKARMFRLAVVVVGEGAQGY